MKRKGTIRTIALWLSLSLSLLVAPLASAMQCETSKCCCPVEGLRCEKCTCTLQSVDPTPAEREVMALAPQVAFEIPAYPQPESLQPNLNWTWVTVPPRRSPTLRGPPDPETSGYAGRAPPVFRTSL